MTTSLLVPNMMGKPLNYRLERAGALILKVNVRLNLDLPAISFLLGATQQN